MQSLGGIEADWKQNLDEVGRIAFFQDDDLKHVWFDFTVNGGSPARYSICKNRNPYLYKHLSKTRMFQTSILQGLSVSLNDMVIGKGKLIVHVEKPTKKPDAGAKGVTAPKDFVFSVLFSVDAVKLLK
jgi:hypothetical protein